MLIRDISDRMFLSQIALIATESLYVWNLAFCEKSQFVFGKDEKYRAVKMAFLENCWCQNVLFLQISDFQDGRIWYFS